MTAKLHMMKLAPGVESRAMMQSWIDRERAFSLSQGLGDTVFLETRNAPKRAEELLDGGSLYWVWKSQIMARQAIRSIEVKTDGANRKFCVIGLDPELVEVAPAPRRPYQGWRYAGADSVPPDLAANVNDLEGMSDEMKAELSRIGILR